VQVRVVVVRVSGRVVVIGVCGLVAAQAWLVGWSSWPLPGRADRGQPPVQRSDIGGSAGDRGAPPKIAPGRAGPRPRPGCRRSLAGVLADPALGQLFGIVVDPAGGTTLWGRNSTATATAGGDREAADRRGIADLSEPDGPVRDPGGSHPLAPLDL